MIAQFEFVIAASVLVAALLIPAALAGPSNPGSATVRVSQSKLGRILVDGRGHTLYLFEKDKSGTSSCNGACAADWLPLISSGRPRAGAGAKPSLLSRTKRKDGRWQVTYNRHPLYTLIEDTKQGQTRGEGVEAYGAEWYAISPAGAKVEKDETTDSGSDDAAPGGYGP